MELWIETAELLLDIVGYTMDIAVWGDDYGLQLSDDQPGDVPKICHTQKPKDGGNDQTEEQGEGAGS